MYCYRRWALFFNDACSVVVLRSVDWGLPMSSNTPECLVG